MGKTAYDNRHLVQEYWTYLKARLDIGQTQIAITGYPNAGKTILAEQLNGQARPLGYEKPEVSTKTEPSAIKLGEWHKLFRVIPGQHGKRSKAILNSFYDNNSLEGVIHVTDFGYNLPRTAASAATLIERDNINTIDELRQYNFISEINEIKAITHDIERSFEKNGTPKWLVIAVNKVDLFPDRLDEALLRYHPEGISEVSKILRDLQNKIGSKNIKIEIVPICVFEEDFHWNEQAVKSRLQVNQRDTYILDAFNSISMIAGSEV